MAHWMTTAAAISDAHAAELLLGVAALVALWGLWLLLSDAARRTALMQRGTLDVQRRRLLHQSIDARLMRTRRGADLAGRLRSAGTDLTPSRFIGLVVAAALGTYVLVSLLFPPLLAIAASGGACWAYFGWLGRRLERRKELFVNQLPEMARLLSNGAAAGLSMPAAIELAAREIDAPANEELQTVVAELRLGRSLDESLASLQRRLPSREIAVLMTTLIIQQRAGGDVVRALHELSEALDTRRDTLREMRTLVAGSVYTSYIVPGLGIGTLFLLDTINSSTLQRMTTEPLGIAALVVAGILYAIGSLAIRRTTRIDI